MSSQFRSHLRQQTLTRVARKARAHAPRQVTVGDLISAAVDVSGSTEGAALLLSPVSPLGRLLGRKIVLD